MDVLATTAHPLEPVPDQSRIWPPPYRSTSRTSSPPFKPDHCPKTAFPSTNDGQLDDILLWTPLRRRRLPADETHGRPGQHRPRGPIVDEPDALAHRRDLRRRPRRLRARTTDRGSPAGPGQ